MSNIHDCGVCGLPNEIHGESCLCREAVATLRTRAEQAEAERDALGRSLDASASTVALLSAQVGRAEAEVARLNSIVQSFVAADRISHCTSCGSSWLGEGDRERCPWCLSVERTDERDHAQAEVARLKRQIEEMQAFARDWRDGTATLIDEAEEAAKKSEGEIDLLRKVYEATKRYLDDGGAFAYDDMNEAIAMADRHFKET